MSDECAYMFDIPQMSSAAQVYDHEAEDAVALFSFIKAAKRLFFCGFFLPF